MRENWCVSNTYNMIREIVCNIVRVVCAHCVWSIFRMVFPAVKMREPVVVERRDANSFPWVFTNQA